MKLDRKDLLLYAVTDRSWLGEESLYSQVEQGLRAGVTFVQLREKDLAKDGFLQEAKEIKGLCKQYKVPFIINDDVDIGLAVDSDGVHVGQEDMKAKDVRQLIGNQKILGVSVHSVEQAIKAEKKGADYLGVGAVFHTSSKDDANEVSFESLKAICEAVSIPVVAIGGISKDNIVRLAGSGIAGIAVISAIFGQADIYKATVELKELVKRIVN